LNVSDKPKITREMCGLLPRKRDVVSFSGGLDVRGILFLLKMKSKERREELIRIPPPLAIYIAASLRKAISRHSYKDIRRRAGDKKPQLGLIKSFPDNQPSFLEEEWDCAKDKHPSVAIGCEVHSFSNAVFIAFQVTPDTFRIYRFPPAISFYLAEMIEEADHDGSLLDISRIQPGDHSLH
jgi:hypothetical protein